MDEVDVLVITALQEELDPILALKEGGEKAWGEPDLTKDGFLYYTTNLPLNDTETFSIRACTQWRPGPTVAASTTTRMLSFPKPLMACISGICAGRRSKNIEFGDVIIAERAFFYDVGKLKEGRLEPENLSYQPNPNTIQWMKAFDSKAKQDNKWVKEINSKKPPSIRYQKEWLLFQLHHRLSNNQQWPNSNQELKLAKKYCPDWSKVLEYLEKEELISCTPSLKLTEKGIDIIRDLKIKHLQSEPRKDHKNPDGRLGAFATGNSVVEIEKYFDEISKDRERNVLAIDMEAAAFLQSIAESYPGLPSFAVKGVVDYASPEKGDSHHKYAAKASAQYMIHFVRFALPLLKKLREKSVSSDFQSTSLKKKI
jgi:nucleoside phosphorylase